MSQFTNYLLIEYSSIAVSITTLYSGASEFNSQPGDSVLGRGFSWFSSIPHGKSLDITWKYSMTASFHILSHIFTYSHHLIWCYIKAKGSIIKQIQFFFMKRRAAIVMILKSLTVFSYATGMYHKKKGLRRFFLAKAMKHFCISAKGSQTTVSVTHAHAHPFLTSHTHSSFSKVLA